MLATFIFALTPATFEWLIMGGGVTRSPAFFFALLTLLSIYRLYTRQKKLDILLTAILASITILLHPETAVDTAASALIFFLFFGRNKAGLVKSILVAIITILLTSPWWVTVLYNHGFSPFLAAGKTGWHNLQQLINLFRFDLTNEYDLKSIGVLGFIGLFFYLRRKKYFFPVLFLAIYITQPRSAAYFETPLFAIFASYSLLVILNVLNQYFRRNASSTNGDHPFSSLASKVLFALLTCQWVFSAFATVIVMFNTISILPADKIAFTWITSNTPSNSRFLVLTGDAPLTDPVSEWFPALTDRISVGTAQGYEWLTKYNFNDMLQRALDAQNCNDQSLDCVASWKNKYDMDFDYIYIRKTVSRNGLKQEPISSALEALLLKSDDYSLVYRSDQVVIFFKRT
jgi:uncharacterized membrane protein